MYSLYAQTKEKLRFATYRGYNLCNPTAAVLAHLLFDKRSPRKKIRSAIKLIRLTPRYSQHQQLKGDAYIWHCDRDDQTKLALNIGKRLSEQRRRTISYMPAIKEDSVKALDWRAMYAAWRITRRCSLPLRLRLYVFSALCHTIKHFRAIDRLQITQQLTSLVSYNSANIPECFLVAACRQKGLPTYSLQHGLYHRYRGEQPIDIINYENVTAGTLLVWSEFSRAEIVAFHRDIGRMPDYHIQVAGYIAPPESHRTPLPSAQRGKHILCVLPGKRYVADSIELLELLMKLASQCRLTVRLHPLLADDAALMAALPSNASLDDSPTLAQALAEERYDLAIGFNTTSLFEAMLFDVPCALYRANSLNLIADGVPVFSNAEELAQLADAPIDTRQLADYLLGASFFRYADIINAAET
ncbi:hypothetical protein N5F07_07890 [Pseudomonas chengduensis]|nr:hypothetical protein [Pseudomonas chengduensis]MDH1621080.1 hypothetical protein [Pseudomonas chengduensis]